jgi:hypothetical protein
MDHADQCTGAADRHWKGIVVVVVGGRGDNNGFVIKYNDVVQTSALTLALGLKGRGANPVSRC